MPAKNEIHLTVDLDDNKVPTRIQWEAPDSGNSYLHYSLDCIAAAGFE